MKKVYYLSTCTTCKRIIKDHGLAEHSFHFQDIKYDSINAKELEDLYSLSGSYEGLFSKTARKYKDLDLRNKELKEEDYKKLLLEEYTFLKRPVIIIDDQIFIGNSKSNLQNLAKALS